MILSNLSDRGTLRGSLGRVTDDYNNLINKPSINGHELVGDQGGHALGLANLSDVIEVEANPDGAATDDLEKLRVDSTIYQIPDVLVYGEASGAIASFPDGADNRPLQSLKVAITPQQASGTPSPSNPLPISGWSGSNVTRCGKNLFDASSNDKEWVNTEGVITNVPTAKSVRRKVIGGEYYTISNDNITSAQNIILIAFFDNNGTLLSRNVEASGAKFKTAQAPNNSAIMIASFYNWSLVNSGMVEKSPNVTTYEPYNGTTYPITWSDAGTVYGGELDVTTGELTSNISQKVKINDISRWETITVVGHNVFRGRGLINAKSSFSPSSTCEIATTNATLSSNNSFTMGYTGFYLNDVLIRMDDYATIESFLEAVGDYSFVYEVQTPTTHQLTPITNINTLLGNNNIWSDTGDITECVYQRDLNLAINELFSLLQNQSSTRSLSALNLTKSVSTELKEETTEETKEEEQNEDKR